MAPPRATPAHPSSPRPRPCVAVVTHVLNVPVRAVFERLRREMPADHDARVILSTDDPQAALAGLAEADVERISRADILRLPFPEKCRADKWEMAGNLDLVFLEFARRNPGYDQYWFIEYDVHWEGVWSTFFEHFRASPAGVLAASVHRMDDAPHKEFSSPYPPFVVPQGMAWPREHYLKAFLPICRVSREALDALHRGYGAGLRGHYEVMIPSVAAQNGMAVEDYGGRGAFVRPENQDRFYFAHPETYSHSPGNFVFRPSQSVLRRRNTLWHPVKPEGVPLWHPLRIEGGVVKSLLEWGKPHAWRALIRLWFATRWRPLRDPPAGAPGAASAEGGAEAAAAE